MEKFIGYLTLTLTNSDLYLQLNKTLILNKIIIKKKFENSNGGKRKEFKMVD